MTEPSAAVRFVWDAIPNVGCKGLCVDCCGPIGASAEERRLLAERGIDLHSPERLADFLLGREDPPDCEALVDGRCSVYDVRPTVCRLWGATEVMPCPWGCRPDDGLLSAEQAGLLMAASLAVGG